MSQLGKLASVGRSWCCLRSAARNHLAVIVQAIWRIRCIWLPYLNSQLLQLLKWWGIACIYYVLYSYLRAFTILKIIFRLITVYCFLAGARIYKISSLLKLGSFVEIVTYCTLINSIILQNIYFISMC